MHTSLEQIRQRLLAGSFVAVSDDASREDEADLVIAAEHVTEQQMAFLIRNTSGIICVPMQAKRLEQLGLELLQKSQHNTAHFGTPFTMPVDYLPTSRGGVSAEERVSTIRALLDPTTKPEDFGRPGHVFPLQAHPEGLRGRQGHTEAALALLQLAGLQPVAVIGELMDEHGKMMRGDVLHTFLAMHDIPLCTIADILAA